MHLLRWLARRGRYDRLEGSVPAERRRRDALDLAAGHEAEIAEWDIACPEKFVHHNSIWDEGASSRRRYDQEPLLTDDDSDGTGSETAPGAASSDPDAVRVRGFGEDEEWLREGKSGQRECVRDQE